MKNANYSYTMSMQKSHKALKISLLILAILLIAGGLFGILLLEPSVPFGPRLDPARLVNIERTVTVLDGANEPMDAQIYDNDKHYTKLKDMPAHTVNAFIAIEDKRFYKHKGVDYKRVVGATLKNLKSFSFREGASTISQQLIKNTHLSNEKTISRKISEMRIARELERKYTKNEILEMYLNILYFGNSMYGIGSASRIIFDKKPADLTVKESAILAGIINNPSKYNPYRHSDAAIGRGNLVLDQMFENKFIDQETFDKAKAETVTFHHGSIAKAQYINSIIREAAQCIGVDKSELFRRQCTIATYTSQKMQMQITDLPILHADLSGRGVTQYRILVTENASGKIVASVGSAAIDISGLRRQPGSTLKPILCYAPALDNNTAYTVSPILDEKMQFGDYNPSNYKNKYYGWVTLKDALKLSLNIPAVKMLEANTVEYAKAFAQKAGVDFDERDNSLALAVGGMTEGVTLEQIAGTFQTFANGGVYRKPGAIRYIADRNGKLIYRDKRTATQAMRDSTAYLITDMLQACAQSGTAKALASLQNVAAKTGTVGTSNGNSDAYCVTYTPTHTVAVWLGGDMDNGVAGGTIPTQIAKQVLLLLNDTAKFAVPPSVTQLDIDAQTLRNEQRVLLAGTDIPVRYRMKAYFAVDHRPVRYSTVQNPFWDYERYFGGIFDNYLVEDENAI